MWNGRFIDEDGAYGNQCWDLAQKYCREIIGCPRLPTRLGGNGYASDCYTSFLAPLPQYFDRIPNNPNNANQVPLPGDLIIYTNSLGGHIAVVVSAAPGSATLQVFQQNSPLGAAPNIGTLDYKGCLGWLAPKQRPIFDTSSPVSDATTSTLATPEMPSTDFYTVEDKNTFWGLEEAWDLPHGVLQSLNAGQDPRTLRPGQQIRIRPTSLPVAPSDPSTDPVYHVIEPNDTYWDLETELNIPHGRLQALNPTMPSRTLQIGDSILIKPGTALPPAVPEAPAPPAAPIVPAVDETTEVTPDIDKVQLPLSPVAAPALAIKPSFIQQHFSKQKILLDLGAVGTALGGFFAYTMGHHEIAAIVMNILAGLIFGGNRFKGGK
jgi:LysM repeat protein